MASKWALMADNSKYGTLKTNLQNIANKLYTSNNDASKIVKNLDRNYTLDDNSVAAVNSVNNVKNDIMELRSRILDVIIPAIDNQISDNNSEIREIERREEEERRRREEEEERKRKEITDKLRRQSLR